MPTLPRLARIVFALSLAAAAAVLGPAAAARASAAPENAPAAAAPGAVRPDSAAAGTGIGSATQITGSASGALANGSDDWWVIYPAKAGGQVKVTFANNQPSADYCYLTASLESTKGGSDVLDSITLSSGTQGVLQGSEAGSDRYYVELYPDNCGGQDAPYKLTLNSGGGGTPPDPPSATAPAQGSIGAAWPPLRGHVSYDGTLGSSSSSDYYVLYKDPDTSLASIRVENRTPGCYISATLLDSHGDNDGAVQSAGIDGNSALDFSVPATESGDPAGRYFMVISDDDCSGGGEAYSVEPEPAAQWTSPAKPAASSVTSGTSIGDAWPPLRGGIAYGHSLGSSSSQDWFVLYKKPDSDLGSVRVENFTPGCYIEATLYYAAGTSLSPVQDTGVDGDGSVTFSVPAREPGDAAGRYYLLVRDDDCTGGGESYQVLPGPAGQWLSPARPASAALPSGPTLKAAGGPVRGDVAYSASLVTASSQDWAYLHARGSSNVTVRVENTTEYQDNCGYLTVALDSASGHTLSSATLPDNGAVNLTAGSAADYYLQLTPDGCAPDEPVTAEVIATPASAVFGPGLAVSDLTLAGATAGKHYSTPIKVSGGKKPYTFAAESALPGGLTLNKKTGVISGTAVHAGTFTFSVKITDSTKPAHETVTGKFRLTIS